MREVIRNRSRSIPLVIDGKPNEVFSYTFPYSIYVCFNWIDGLPGPFPLPISQESFPFRRIISGDLAPLQRQGHVHFGSLYIFILFIFR